MLVSFHLIASLEFALENFFVGLDFRCNFGFADFNVAHMSSLKLRICLKMDFSNMQMFSLQHFMSKFPFEVVGFTRLIWNVL